jgi:catechol 2,3-dioxygenase-like lactoylglutathione lyase family enzyme
MTTTEIPTTLRPGHVGINVVDIERSTGFYRDAFGLEVAAEGTDADHHYAFLAADGVLLITLWQQASGRFSANGPGLHHLAFQVESLDAVRAAEARLRALGAEFAHDGVVAHAEGVPSGGIFFLDPDGTRLEIYAPDGGEDADAPTGAAPTCGFF